MAVAADDVPGLVRHALAERIDLTVVGPEDPLVLGVTDAFEAAGLRCFGPTRLAAAPRGLEGFRQGLHDAPRDPDRRATRTFTRGISTPA